MRVRGRDIVAIVAATAWVAVSEFARNELVFKSYWVEHYASLGLDFPDAPVNGAIWGLWSLVFAVLPFGLLWFAFPLSIVEAVVAALIIGRLSPSGA